MVLQTRENRHAKPATAEGFGQRVAVKVSRNRRPLVVAGSCAITAAWFFATGELRPDVALLLAAGSSMSNAGHSLEMHARLEKSGFRKTSSAMLSTGIMDMANMIFSAIPFLSTIYKSGDPVKNGFAYLSVVAVTSVVAQILERRAVFNLSREKFNNAFSHMEIGECAEYARMLEKRERCWWMRPYWVLNPEGLAAIRTEKEKALGYMRDRGQCKSL